MGRPTGEIGPIPNQQTSPSAYYYIVYTYVRIRLPQMLYQTYFIAYTPASSDEISSRSALRRAVHAQVGRQRRYRRNRAAIGGRVVLVHTVRVTAVINVSNTAVLVVLIHHLTSTLERGRQFRLSLFAEHR